MARGSIARFVATRALDSPEGLKEFTGSNNEWAFDSQASTNEVFVFKRCTSNRSANPTIVTGGSHVALPTSSSAKKAIAACPPHSRAAKAAASQSSSRTSPRSANTSPAPPPRLSPTKIKATISKARALAKSAQAPAISMKSSPVSCHMQLRRSTCSK